MKDLKLNLNTVKYVIQQLYALDLKKEWRISITEWSKKRSIPANKVYQSWYPAMSDVLAMTIPETTRFIKLNFGLPILFSDDYIGSIIWEGLNNKGFFQLSYEDQLSHMTELPVTRLFNTKMHNKLRDDLQIYFANLGLNLGYND